MKTTKIKVGVSRKISLANYGGKPFEMFDVFFEDEFESEDGETENDIAQKRYEIYQNLRSEAEGVIEEIAKETTAKAHGISIEQYESLDEKDKLLLREERRAERTLNYRRHKANEVRYRRPGPGGVRSNPGAESSFQADNSRPGSRGDGTGTTGNAISIPPLKPGDAPAEPPF